MNQASERREERSGMNQGNTGNQSTSILMNWTSVYMAAKSLTYGSINLQGPHHAAV